MRAARLPFADTWALDYLTHPAVTRGTRGKDPDLGCDRTKRRLPYAGAANFMAPR